MSKHKELTGRRRYAPYWSEGNPMLVLQVEERDLQTTHIAGEIDTEWNFGWRNADIRDLTVHELKEVACSEIKK